MVRNKNRESIFGNNLMNFLKEFDLYIDVVLMLYMFCVKIIHFLKVRCEKIVKSGDAKVA